jgi:hypothetical protein
MSFRSCYLLVLFFVAESDKSSFSADFRGRFADSPAFSAPGCCWNEFGQEQETDAHRGNIL